MAIPASFLGAGSVIRGPYAPAAATAIVAGRSTAVSARPCKHSAEVPKRAGARPRLAIYRWNGFAWRRSSRRRGENIMQRVILAGAALTWAIYASPAVAQPMPPVQLSAAAQATPQASPPDSQSAPEPPPFPPMPRAKPSHRFTTGDHRTSHAAHRTTHVQHRTTHGRHEAAKEHHRSTRGRHEKSRHEAAKASPRTIRMCHRLTYEKIMRSSSCRALMSHDLSAASEHHRRATHRHGATHHHKTTKTRARHSRRHKS